MKKIQCLNIKCAESSLMLISPDQIFQCIKNVCVRAAYETIIQENDTSVARFKRQLKCK